ncbi:YheU family protein [Desulfobacterales bacterium HSG17]|nr:YheU family protein [Desulfobacterales bacterium HSG17]
MAALKIPYDQLNSETLHGVIEEFVTRDGTDYGEIEVSLEIKISQVLGQLKSGKAVIVFDQATETCNILKSSDPALKKLED